MTRRKKDTPEPVIEPERVPITEPVIEPERVPVIADGVAVTSKRGILGPGTVVSAEDFSGGQETLDNLVKSGHVKL